MTSMQSAFSLSIEEIFPPEAIFSPKNVILGSDRVAACLRDGIMRKFLHHLHELHLCHSHLQDFFVPSPISMIHGSMQLFGSSCLPLETVYILRVTAKQFLLSIKVCDKFVRS